MQEENCVSSRNMGPDMVLFAQKFLCHFLFLQVVQFVHRPGPEGIRTPTDTAMKVHVCPTEDSTLLSGTHGRDRRETRGINKIDLQRAHEGME
jgi:hypothetical protein